MDVNVADAPAHQGAPLDVIQRLRVRRHRRRRQFPQKAEHFAAVFQIAARQLAQDERMHQHAALFKGHGQRRCAGTQMIDPNRRVDQDHADCERRRGTGCNRGSLPPSRARRRALSRSIRALSPS
jgi:hypothetical protein